jgi:hypothetical protein
MGQEDSNDELHNQYQARIRFSNTIEWHRLAHQIGDG